MLLENIELGKTLEIYVDREGYRYRLVSKVEQTSVRRICVTAITANGRAFLFRPEDDIRLVYRDEEQMWEWNKVKAGLAKLENSPVHYFDIVNKGRSFNRRNAYRVEINEDVEFGYYEVPDTREKSALVPLLMEEYEVIVDENGQEVDNPDENTNRTLLVEKRLRSVPKEDAYPHMIKAHIKDISETGMGMFCNEKLNIDDGFFVSIPSTYGKLKTKAMVIRVDDLKAANHRYRYYYGCIYTESDHRLAKFIFEMQRKFIKQQREQKEFEADERAKRKESLMRKKKEQEKNVDSVDSADSADSEES